ncbi:transporter substrate-binding domain-containing protein [Rhodoplanes sp. TEM]|uniref:Transporter substrate-binding domain-containing protein n=1 Tax=Rhodoplanes tepidamans TaxID=200616 RepID=A0ABT5JFX2_RHOTP|nr:MULTISPECIES: transporter substrate-binding domain-containing protein [Rhodoplanes]MDC7788487.1 transporter substrate-binding domain-containing protein [Rhodoplanes tepidamans]MDC7984141.1 transporter substrate-binding domain-containing protein [Rhodoplanes sp. TEM]MDQ0356879.1 polar amino acid transport system substrate-binding protein [Rhodoplanes tepidamans]
MQDVVKELAPKGRVRAAINFGNSVLAQQDPATGEPRGTQAALARELAARLAVPVEYVTYKAAGKVFEALSRDEWDVAFMAVDPVRAAELDFTPPYVLIEAACLVPEGSPLQDIGDVDRPGVRIAGARGSAYELHLTRTLKNAELVLTPSGPEARALFADQGLEAVAGVRQELVAFAESHPGYRVMPGRFVGIEQAIAVPKGRTAALTFLAGFIAEMKQNGFVAQALAASGQSSSLVAP